MSSSKSGVVGIDIKEAISSNSLSSSSTSTDKTISHDKMQQLNEASAPSIKPPNSSNNPFGDNFSTLLSEENDYFGFEFDRIRQKNEQNQMDELTGMLNLQCFFSCLMIYDYCYYYIFIYI
jgi:hypothetical protein